MRQFIDINVDNEKQFKKKLLYYMRNVGSGVILDGNDFNSSGFQSDTIDFIAGVDKLYEINEDFNRLESFHSQHNDWMLGFLTYDLKNEFEQLESHNDDEIELPLFYFFIPRFLIRKREGKWEIGFDTGKDSKEDVDLFMKSVKLEDNIQEDMPEVKLVSRVTHAEYVDVVNKIQHHIGIGDVYEMNYCIEFYAQKLNISPLHLYEKLSEVSPAPFSAFMKYHDKTLICASPERYLKKEGNRLISQPIKGTSPRDQNPFIDKANIEYLKTSEKERSENIMITDLVRNDLSKVAKQGKVKVEELCGVYSFRQVHQMISTISAEMDEHHSWVDAIKATFPMGSMTGAPKVSAMKLIEKYEVTKRGLYSGSVGYVTPEGDFDFNVVIRSMLYNQKKGYLSFMVGSAITALAEPEKEYEECLVKASAIMKVLNAEE
ncbi:MAG: anthranilate synthase component I family protein [Chlorobi bacterium]|nr:anthranilate synthase component I family protein [Chlorobiota bacterium]